MIEEPFASGNSPIHRLDPRFRTVAALFLSVEAALLQDFRALLLTLLAAIILILIGRLSLFHVLRRLLSLLRFLLLLWLLIPLTYEGDPLFEMGWLAWSREGMLLSARISLKSTAILLLFMALVSTMGLSTLGKALKKLFVSGKLVHLLLMTYRYIFVIGQEYERLETAIRIRGFTPATTLHSYRTVAYLFGMLFVKASKRAERVHQAMILRGFCGRFYTLDDFKPGYGNWLFALVMGLIFLGIFFLEHRCPWQMMVV